MKAEDINLDWVRERIVVLDTGCWEWQEARSAGYAWVYVDGQSRSLAPLVCALAHGPGGDLWALHSCDYRPCVNPEHLRWGTAQENIADRKERGPHPRREEWRTKTRPRINTRGLDPEVELARWEQSGRDLQGLEELAKEHGLTISHMRKIMLYGKTEEEGET